MEGMHMAFHSPASLVVLPVCMSEDGVCRSGQSSVMPCGVTSRCQCGAWWESIISIIGFSLVSYMWCPIDCMWACQIFAPGTISPSPIALEWPTSAIKAAAVQGKPGQARLGTNSRYFVIYSDLKSQLQCSWSCKVTVQSFLISNFVYLHFWFWLQNSDCQNTVWFSKARRYLGFDLKSTFLKGISNLNLILIGSQCIS